MTNDKITEHVKNVCKIGQMEKCCKYLVIGAGGFSCMKSTEANKRVIDNNWALNHHTSQGNNCEGVTDRKILNL